MKRLFSLVLFFLPAILSAQVYSESPFAPGLEAGKAEPMTTREDFLIHEHRAFGSEALLFDTVSAGIDQWKDYPSGWGYGGEAFAKRFGSQAGSKAVREMIGFGLDSALHTDPRVYRSSSTHFSGRLFDALSQVVVARNASGGRVPAFSNVASAFAAGEIQTVWMPAANAHVRDGLVNGGLLLLGDAARDVFREFWPDVKRKLHHGE